MDWIWLVNINAFDWYAFQYQCDVIGIIGTETRSRFWREWVSKRRGDGAAQNDLPPVPNLERVEAALAMLQAEGFERVIFLGYGKGDEMAINMMKSQKLPVEGLILIDMPRINISDDFKALEIPVLEIFASQGLLGVDKAVKQGKAAMKRGAKTNYPVRRTLGAYHVFYGLEPMLLMTVKSWLNASFVKPRF